jgi:LmbE family N-acetylglucosaminyl deacetylase
VSISVLAIHADDCEVLAGGSLALLASKGHRVAVATLTAGDFSGCGPQG